MSKQVKFNIQLNVDGQKVVVAAKTSVEELAKKMSEAGQRSENMRDSLITLNQAAQSFQNINAGLQSLIGQMRDYAAANALLVAGVFKWIKY